MSIRLKCGDRTTENQRKLTFDGYFQTVVRITDYRSQYRQKKNEQFLLYISVDPRSSPVGLYDPGNVSGDL